MSKNRVREKNATERSADKPVPEKSKTYNHVSMLKNSKRQNSECQNLFLGSSLKTFALILPALPALMLTAPSAYAADTADLANVKIVYAEATEAEKDTLKGLIEEITVLSTKSQQSSYRTPASVTVVTKAEIDQLVPITISDLFYDAPNVLFTGGPRRNGQAPSIRGTGGAGVLILFDGIRQNFLSAHDGRFFIDPNLLKSAEIVRGPASSLYGAGALGGVIAFETLDASDFLGESSFGFQAFSNLQSGSDQTTAGFTTAGQSEDQRLGGLLSLSYRETGDISLGDGSTLIADDEIASGLGKITYAATKDLTLDAQWLRYQGQSIEPNNGQGLTFGDLVDKDIDSNTFRVGLTYNPEQNKLINLGFVGYRAENNVSESELNSDRSILRSFTTTGFLLNNRALLTQQNSLSATLITGIEYYEDNQAGEDSSVIDGTRGGVPDASGSVFGAFVSAEIDAQSTFGDFLLTPSIRFDRFQSTDITDSTINNENEEMSLRVAASWQPIDWLLIFGSYGEAFRAPAFNEIFADGLHFEIPLGPRVSAPNLFVPNTALLPEDSATAEFGVGFNFNSIILADDRLRFKSTYFTSDVNNLIDLEVNVEFSPSCFNPMIPQPCTSGTSRNINTQSAQLEGIELEANYQSDFIYASAAFATITGRDQISNEFVGILTPDRFTLDAGFKLDTAGIRAGYRLEINGRFVDVNDPAEERPGFEILDLYASYSPLQGMLKGLRVDLGIDNVTDATAERVFAGVPDLGRNYKAALSWKWLY